MIWNASILTIKRQQHKTDLGHYPCQVVAETLNEAIGKVYQAARILFPGCEVDVKVGVQGVEPINDPATVKLFK